MPGQKGTPEHEAFFGALDKARGHLHTTGERAGQDAAEHLSSGATRMIESLAHAVAAGLRGERELSQEAQDAAEAAEHHFRTGAGHLAAHLGLRALTHLFGRGVDAIRGSDELSSAQYDAPALSPAEEE